VRPQRVIAESFRKTVALYLNRRLWPLQVSASSEICPVCMLRAVITEEASPEQSASELALVGSNSERPGPRFEKYELMLHADGRPVELGRGAMGVTYKALDVDLRCPVTLKVISERYLGDESARLQPTCTLRRSSGLPSQNTAP
jgi:hypothetical protein